VRIAAAYAVRYTLTSWAQRRYQAAQFTPFTAVRMYQVSDTIQPRSAHMGSLPVMCMLAVPFRHKAMVIRTWMQLEVVQEDTLCEAQLRNAL
jgi:hypothetical protein